MKFKTSAALAISIALLPAVGSWGSAPPISVTSAAHSKQLAVPIPCGPTWENAESPNVGENSNHLVSVSGTSPSDVWAVGSWDITPWDGRTLIEHFDGTAWSVVPSPNLGEGNNYLTGVAAISPDDAWAVGYYIGGQFGDPIPLILHWDGNVWSDVPAPELSGDDLLHGVAAVSSDDVWAVGAYENEQETLILHWDGNVWSKVPSPSVGGGQDVLRDVVAISPSDAWAVGYYEPVGLGWGHMTLHWDGAAWAVVPGPLPPDAAVLLAVDMFDAKSVWAVGGGGGPNELRGGWAQTWNGAEWEDRKPLTGTFANFLSGVSVLGPNDVWVVGEQVNQETWDVNETLVEHWDGAEWTVMSTPNVGEGDNTLSAVTEIDGQIWSVGSYEDTATGYFRTLTQRICPVEVGEDGFSPRVARADRGETVAWRVPSAESRAHTITEGNRLQLFDSGPQDPGSSFLFTFWAAGTYRVIDRTTGNWGAVRVPMEAYPRSGGTETEFQVTWASPQASPTYVYDVQVRRPGSPGFEAWLTGTSLRSATFLPDSGSGVYSFRARMRVSLEARASGWSEAVRIRVS